MQGSMEAKSTTRSRKGGNSGNEGEFVGHREGDGRMESNLSRLKSAGRGWV